MFRLRILPLLSLLFGLCAPNCQAQLGKNVLIPAGSEADKQLKAINDASDPAQKLALMNDFAQANPEGDLAIVANEQLVNYYIAAKQYDKAFEYGDKLFAIDPNNFSNCVNMVRAANEKGDTARLFNYGTKAGDIIERYLASPPPQGVSAEAWKEQKTQKLETVKDDRNYIESSLLNAAYQQKAPAKKAEYLQLFARSFPDSPNAEQALSVSAFSYQAVPDRAKMLQVANSTLDKYPNNIGMLILLADDYSEKAEQLDKAETYAKRAILLCDSAKKPEGVSDADWQKQSTLQKGLAMSALGQVNIERKDNLSAVKNLTAAGPLLKSNAGAYARNQYRLGFAYLNLRKLPEAKQALTEAASLETPYKGPAQQKLKDLANSKAARN
jgi:tetratricopeptide (TPR) repeat protein